MNFRIDRDKWYRGEGSTYSQLLLEDGTMCCLGQVARQCGIEEKYLAGSGVPSDVERSRMLESTFPAWLLRHNDDCARYLDSVTCNEAMGVNDNEDISDEVREARLKEIFAAQEDSLEFYNGSEALATP